MVLADAHLQAGDAEQACHVALGALQLGEQLLSARCARYLRDFHTTLVSGQASRQVARTFAGTQVTKASFPPWTRIAS
jgi:hypothetical protein